MKFNAITVFILLSVLSFRTTDEISKYNKPLFLEMSNGKMKYTAVDTISYPPCEVDDIPKYKSFKVSEPLKIDGHLNEQAWLKAPRSNSFRDLVSGRETIHDTRAAVLWDEEYLYVAFWVEEPFLEATLTERDDLIYKDNDVEFFIAGKDTYYEFEINTFGTIYEVFFVWEDAYKRDGYDKIPGLTTNEPKSRNFRGVGYRHPRGTRKGFWNWDLEGIKTAVHADGTINDNKDRDRGWTVELALPWSSLEILAKGDNRSVPPEDKDVWRMDFSRFNQYREAKPAKDNGGWAWSPHGVWDSHVPECYTIINFSTEDVNKVNK